MTKKTLQTTLKVAAPVALFTVIGALGLRLMTADNALVIRRPQLPRVKVNPVGLASKRAFDIVVGGLGLLAVSPLLLAIALVIKIHRPARSSIAPAA